MNKLLIFTALLLGVFVGLLVGKNSIGRQVDKNIIQKVIERPFDKYAIENLSKAQVKPSEIVIEKTLKDNANFTSYLFSFSFDPTLTNKEAKKVTGIINIPKGKGEFPVIVMFRGYVDQKLYESGVGTRKAADVFAGNGYITIAPDFLGYGESDKEAENVFEARFQTYTTALSLIPSVQSIKEWDKKNLFLWGHSNGGQIALTVLEITGYSYPTVLWAPVSKPFPYSILYYTDESDDRGKLIRHELAKFEENYDVELYSLTNYLDKIKAPLQIHQGTKDDAVPANWTDSLVKTLQEKEIDVDYFKYPGADHNLTPGWNTVVERNLNFFNKSLDKTK